MERRRFKNIAIPNHLLDDIVDEDCILFIGAGASTEGQGTSYWKELLVDQMVEEWSSWQHLTPHLNVGED